MAESLAWVSACWASRRQGTSSASVMGSPSPRSLGCHERTQPEPFSKKEHKGKIN